MSMKRDTIESDRANAPSNACAVVIIGRNEGDRLRRSIESVRDGARTIVYVDSGSTDGSVEMALSKGADAVSMDMSIPFTAARARNAGFARLVALGHAPPFVQFVDGDCEVLPGWFDRAQDFLERHADVAALCGGLRERYPHRSVYNLLCDMEWRAPAGESRSTGGNAMLRSAALSAAGGYREDLIAGEEPELCVRLRQAGWKIWRLSDEMALHDAAMTSFGQWWKRTRRSGHAAAEGAALHGKPPEWHNVAQLTRSILWGAVLPLVIISLSLAQPVWSLLLLAYPLQVVRLGVRDGVARREVWLRAAFLVLGRFPEALGAMTYWLNRLRRRQGKIMEYK